MRTMLTHECGGPVIIDLSEVTKLVSPSFSLNQNGISDFTIDLDIKNKSFIPRFSCKQCDKELPEELLKREVKALCQVCGKLHPVDSLSTNSNIATICNLCKTRAIKYVNKEISIVPDYIQMFVENYGITSGFSLVPLYTVLLNRTQL